MIEKELGCAKCEMHKKRNLRFWKGGMKVSAKREKGENDTLD